MEKEKDLRLVNIYIAIHNKKVLTLDDLAYLAWYNPTCFKKTCENLAYKMPETKPLVELPKELNKKKLGKLETNIKRDSFDLTVEEQLQNVREAQWLIESLKRIEADDSDVISGVDAGHVRKLLGDLYMESLFPHDDRIRYFDICEEAPGSKFSMQA